MSRSVALALVGSAAAFSPMMSMDLGRRSIVQAGAASAVAAPLLRPQEAQAGLPVDALCAGKACNSAPVLPSPPSWPNVRCHSWPRTEVVYSLHWPGHHHLRSPRVQARGAERGVHRRSCRRRGRRDVRQGMIPAMATGVLVFDLLKLSRSPSDDENCLQVQMGKPNIDARKFLSEAISLKSKGIDGAYKSAA